MATVLTSYLKSVLTERKENRKLMQTLGLEAAKSGIKAQFAASENDRKFAQQKELKTMEGANAAKTAKINQAGQTYRAFGNSRAAKQRADAANISREKVAGMKGGNIVGKGTLDTVQQVSALMESWDSMDKEAKAKGMPAVDEYNFTKGQAALDDNPIRKKFGGKVSRTNLRKYIADLTNQASKSQDAEYIKSNLSKYFPDAFNATDDSSATATPGVIKKYKGDIRSAAIQYLLDNNEDIDDANIEAVIQHKDEWYGA